MSSYKIKVHTLTGCGIVNEKSLKVGDIVDDKIIDDATAEKLLKRGWIELIKSKDAPKVESKQESKDAPKVESKDDSKDEIL